MYANEKKLKIKSSSHNFRKRRLCPYEIWMFQFTSYLYIYVNCFACEQYGASSPF